jgi:hypothetical protein
VAPAADARHPYRLALSGTNVAATSFEAPTVPDGSGSSAAYAAADIAKQWEDGLAFAPVPAGSPGGAVPVTKLELQLAGAVSAGSGRPRAAFAALRTLEATGGPSLLVSASPPLAGRLFSQGALDTRLVAALRRGLQAGRAGLPDLIDASGVAPLLRVLPSIRGMPPAAAGTRAARQLRCQLDSRQCDGGGGDSTPGPPRARP